MSTFSFILAGICLNAVAQLLLKAGTNAVGIIEFGSGKLLETGLALAVQPPILGGLACYAISVVVWIVGLSRVNVTIAYPMLSLGYIVNALGAWMFLGESLSLQRIAAIGIIIGGVALLVRS
jgi:drug/metabolite transporter (DMT)-like permease